MYYFYLLSTIRAPRIKMVGPVDHSLLQTNGQQALDTYLTVPSQSLSILRINERIQDIL